VAVEGLLQALLVEGVANESDGACQHKEAVKVANVDNVVNLSLGEHARTSQQVQEEGPDGTIDIEHKVVGLGESVRLHLHRILHVLDRWEVCVRILLQQLHTLVPVVPALYPVTDPWHPDPLLLHSFHKLIRRQPLFTGTGTFIHSNLLFVCTTCISKPHKLR
jgi:hypothetical protein